MGQCSYIEEYELSSCELNNTQWLTLDGKKMFVKVVDVHDADTITIAFLWHNTKYLKKMRLSGIDSAEMVPRLKSKYRDEEIAHSHLGKARMEELCLNKIVYVHTGDWDKYGRLLGTIYLKSYSKESINDILVKEKLAYYYDGKKKKSFAEWYKNEK
jgi:endonuclease YncB( thermonuclease family)